MYFFTFVSLHLENCIQRYFYILCRIIICNTLKIVSIHYCVNKHYSICKIVVRKKSIKAKSFWRKSIFISTMFSTKVVVYYVFPLNYYYFLFFVLYILEWNVQCIKEYLNCNKIPVLGGTKIIFKSKQIINNVLEKVFVWKT